MLKPDVIAPVYKSIVRWIGDTVEELQETGGFPAMQYQDWESRGDENKLPQTTLVGMDGFSFDENDDLWIIRFAVAISSYRDAGLLNEIELISALHRRMGEGAKIPLREMDLGEQINELVVTDFELAPMAQSNLRNYRTIGMTVLRTGTD
jgi:hypothetical protein